MDLGLTDRVYVVTGASRGLGFAAAEVLVAEGARVVLSAREEAAVHAATERLGRDRAVGVPADLADPQTPGRLIAGAQESFGHLDGALISVGGPRRGQVLDLTDDEWRAGFETVFLGAVRVARSVAGELGEGGSIALVLSTSVKEPVADLAISNALRPGLGMVVKMLAQEVGPRGVRVNGLLPGRVDTDRVRELDDATPDPGATRAAVEATIPLRRYGRPEELGRAAAFVLSPAASYVTGHMMAVDGGITRSL